jgi:HEAT repeat protein
VEVRAAVATALGKVGPSAVAALAEAAASDADANVRWRAAAALGEIGSAAASAVPQLAGALADPAPRVRFHAAQALGCIGPAAGGAASRLGKVAVSKREEIGIRRKAVQALGMIGPEAGAGIPFLAEAARDTDTWIRVCAAEALGETAATSQVARSVLEGLLRDDEEPVRRAARRALERLNGSGD